MADEYQKLYQETFDVNEILDIFSCIFNMFNRIAFNNIRQSAMKDKGWNTLEKLQGNGTLL